VSPAHSVAAGLDYPGVGPEHAALKDSGRARYVAVDDAQAVGAFKRLSRLEGLIPALESAHAIAWVLQEAGHWPRDAVVLVNLSGRGDKDVAAASALEGGTE
jgi:tryptophan synthase beta chain